jgi:hypothetical protein
MVLVPGHDQVHAVPVEQRQPLLPDPEVSAVEVGRGHRDLVHAHDDPVDVSRQHLPPGETLLVTVGVLAAGAVVRVHLPPPRNRAF